VIARRLASSTASLATGYIRSQAQLRQVEAQRASMARVFAVGGGLRQTPTGGFVVGWLPEDLQAIDHYWHSGRRQLVRRNESEESRQVRLGRISSGSSWDSHLGT
jgi:hypothetical protein